VPVCGDHTPLTIPLKLYSGVSKGVRSSTRAEDGRPTPKSGTPARPAQSSPIVFKLPRRYSDPCRTVLKAAIKQMCSQRYSWRKETPRSPAVSRNRY